MMIRSPPVRHHCNTPSVSQQRFLYLYQSHSLIWPFPINSPSLTPRDSYEPLGGLINPNNNNSSWPSSLEDSISKHFIPTPEIQDGTSTKDRYSPIPSSPAGPCEGGSINARQMWLIDQSPRSEQRIRSLSRVSNSSSRDQSPRCPEEPTLTPSTVGVATVG